jgi:hypothetical protein
MTPYPSQTQPPAPRKSGRGCLIALLVVGGIGLLASIAIGIGIYAFATSPTGKTAFKVIGESTRIATEGMKAPGAAEVRKLGCEQAMVIEMKDFAVLVAEISDADVSKMPDELIVTCQVGRSRTTPSCDDVASTYVKAVVRASHNFVASVTQQGGKALCQNEYDPTGALIGPYSTKP